MASTRPLVFWATYTLLTLVNNTQPLSEPVHSVLQACYSTSFLLRQLGTIHLLFRVPAQPLLQTRLTTISQPQDNPRQPPSNFRSGSLTTHALDFITSRHAQHITSAPLPASLNSQSARQRPPAAHHLLACPWQHRACPRPHVTPQHISSLVKTILITNISHSFFSYTPFTILLTITQLIFPIHTHNHLLSFTQHQGLMAQSNNTDMAHWHLHPPCTTSVQTLAFHTTVTYLSLCFPSQETLPLPFIVVGPSNLQPLSLENFLHQESAPHDPLSRLPSGRQRLPLRIIVPQAQASNRHKYTGRASKSLPQSLPDTLLDACYEMLTTPANTTAKPTRAIHLLSKMTPISSGFLMQTYSPCTRLSHANTSHKYVILHLQFQPSSFTFP